MVSFYSIEDFNRFNFNKYTRYSNTFNIDKILNKITKMSNKKNSIILYKHNSLNSVIKLNRRVNNINMIYVNYLSSIMYILPLYIRVYIGKIMLFILFRLWVNNDIKNILVVNIIYKIIIITIISTMLNISDHHITFDISRLITLLIPFIFEFLLLCNIIVDYDFYNIKFLLYVFLYFIFYRLATKTNKLYALLLILICLFFLCIIHIKNFSIIEHLIL